MWALQNHTPFVAERAWVRDKNGAEIWIVVVKGTYSIDHDGATRLDQNQVEVNRVPKYRGEPGRSSLLYEADLIHSKPATDVIVHGHAYAPAGSVATQVDVVLRAGSIEKRLRVFGDRYWEDVIFDLVKSPPEPFERMPITYERAFGGCDELEYEARKENWERRNPIGVGFASKTAHLAGGRLPNVEDPGHLIARWNDRPRPIGLGPLARDWAPRVDFAGTYDEQWRRKRLPILPLDFDERFWQCAPEDQQGHGYFKGGELVELFNLTPHGYLKLTLPKVRLIFFTELGRQVIEHRANLHTVMLEPDVSRLILVWHTMLSCHGKDHQLLRTVINEKEYVPLGHSKRAPMSV